MIVFLVTFYRFGKSVRLALKDPEFEVLLTLLIVLIASDTIFYHGTEGWGWLDSMYFSVTTLTTLGPGSVVPHTGVRKIFTMASLLLGIDILLSFVSV